MGWVHANHKFFRVALFQKILGKFRAGVLDHEPSPSGLKLVTYPDQFLQTNPADPVDVAEIQNELIPIGFIDKA